MRGIKPRFAKIHIYARRSRDGLICEYGRTCKEPTHRRVVHVKLTVLTIVTPEHQVSAARLNQVSHIMPGSG